MTAGHADGERIARLAPVTETLRDRGLARLRAAAIAREATLARLAALERPLPPGMDPVLAARLALHHEIWAAPRRRELNLVLARQTAAWMEARQDAARAFGRAEAIAVLARAATPARA